MDANLNKAIAKILDNMPLDMDSEIVIEDTYPYPLLNGVRKYRAGKQLVAKEKSSD
jgi:hypothetical protein